MKTYFSSYEYKNAVYNKMYVTGKYTKLISTLKKNVVKYPNDPFYLRLLGLYLIRLKRPDEAIHYLNLALEFDDDNKSTVFTNLGTANYLMGNFEETLKYSNLSLDIDSNNKVSILNKANALYSLGEISEALLMYNLILDSDPTHAKSLYGKELCLKFNQDFENCSEV